MDKLRLMALISFRSTADPKEILNIFKQYVQQKAGDQPLARDTLQLLSKPLRLEDVDILVNRIEQLTGLTVNPAVVNKLRAYASLLTNDKALQEWHIFEKVANALMDGIFDAEHVDPPSDVELVYAGYIFKRDAADRKHLISNEVKRYVQTLWEKVYGFIEPHPWLSDFWPLPKTSRTLLVHKQHDEFLKSLQNKREFEIDELLAHAQNVNEMQALRMALLSLEALNALNV